MFSMSVMRIAWRRELDSVGCLTLANQATYSTQCTQLASRLSNITTVTTGQKNIGSLTSWWWA